MMKEYIEREKVVELTEVIKYSFASLHQKVIDALIYNIDKNIPSADVEPVRHGEWREETEYYDDEYSEYNTRKVFACSLCGRIEKIKQPYCNCGAKMDGGKK